MIIYDLACDVDHLFEGWFKHADDFKAQQDKHLIACPVCASSKVTRRLSANRVVTSSTSSKSVATMSEQQKFELAKQWATKVHETVEKHTDDVGNKFAEEARKIHYGESEERGIRGTATVDDAKQLNDEGIKAYPLPPKPIEKEKLN